MPCMLNTNHQNQSLELSTPKSRIDACENSIDIAQKVASRVIRVTDDFSDETIGTLAREEVYSKIPLVKSLEPKALATRVENILTDVGLDPIIATAAANGAFQAAQGANHAATNRDLRKTVRNELGLNEDASDRCVRSARLLKDELDSSIPEVIKSIERQLKFLIAEEMIYSGKTLVEIYLSDKTDFLKFHDFVPLQNQYFVNQIYKEFSHSTDFDKIVSIALEKGLSLEIDLLCSVIYPSHLLYPTKRPYLSYLPDKLKIIVYVPGNDKSPSVTLGNIDISYLKNMEYSTAKSKMQSALSTKEKIHLEINKYKNEIIYCNDLFDRIFCRLAIRYNQVKLLFTRK